jgi:hypothetical protein
VSLNIDGSDWFLLLRNASIVLPVCGVFVFQEPLVELMRVFAVCIVHLVLIELLNRACRLRGL